MYISGMVFCPSSLFYFECYIFYILWQDNARLHTQHIRPTVLYTIYRFANNWNTYCEFRKFLELISHHNKPLNKYILISCDFSSTKTNWTVKNDPILNPSGSWNRKLILWNVVCLKNIIPRGRYALRTQDSLLKTFI
jgi:hypothetical protein